MDSFGSLHHLFFHKAMLSSPPDADGDFTIMMIRNVRCQLLSFAQARDKGWTSISTHYGYTDMMMYHNAKFCIINYGGIIKIWEPNWLPLILGSSRIIWPNPYRAISNWSTNEPKNIMFLVFSLDDEEYKWKKLKSSHEQMLFLEYNQFMCLSVIDFLELKQDYIYFIGDNQNSCKYYRHTTVWR